MKKIKFISVLALSSLLTACSCSEPDNIEETTTLAENTTSTNDSKDYTASVEATEEKITTEEPTTEKPTDDTSAYIPNGKTPQLLVDVLRKNAEFTLVYTEYNMDTLCDEKKVERDTKLSDYVHRKAQEEDMLVELGEYRVVDMDVDGYNEVIANVPSQMVLLFHYEEGEVYAYEMPWRAVVQVTFGGICRGSSGASYCSESIYEFDKESYTETEIALMDGDTYYVEGEQVSEEEYWEFINSDEFREGDVPYWYDYDTLLSTLERVDFTD